MLYNLRHALAIWAVTVTIESVLGHSFLACSLTETSSDTELSGIHWSRKVSIYSVMRREAQKMERHDTAIVLLRNRVQYRAHIQG